MRQWTVDAFASAPFKGNPACVLEPMDAWPSDAWMQSLAAENNQAETAYLRKTADPTRFDLRWFTPAMEVPFCGHATLASAHVLLGELGVSTSVITFNTRRRGELRVGAAQEGYRMDFPADPPRKLAPPPALAAALGAEPVELWGGQFLLAIMADEATLRRLAPEVRDLAALGVGTASEPGNVIVAALADATSPYDVVSRFFAPGSGIDEDPTTGSAHTMLGPLFAARLGKARLKFHQAYPGRGGDLEVEMAGDRAILFGRAVTVIESRLRLKPGSNDAGKRKRPGRTPAFPSLRTSGFDQRK